MRMTELDIIVSKMPEILMVIGESRSSKRIKKLKVLFG
jgi:hypothetical protein